jgi:anti-sigma B factor antagonist
MMSVADQRQPEDKVWVALHKQTALIRVDGRGSFKVSTALKEFGLSALQAGCQTAVLDMSRCIGMDSTFMGVLAGLASRLKQRNGGTMVLLNLAPRTRGLVATLGLDQVVQAYEPGQTPDALKGVAALSEGLSALQGGAENRLDTTRTMIEAHENLVDLSPENLPRFKDVLTYLREDLNRKGEGNRERS